MPNSLKEIVKRIVEEVDPDKIILFGSRAKDEKKGWSDYDICVLKSDTVKRNNLEKRIYLKLIGVGVPLDIIVETVERFKELKENKFLIYREIAKYGKTIYEK
jgi:predicted nucleotidyltransferase